MPDFKLPNLGENITVGDVVKILVSTGDKVSKDQPILELETDKAVLEVPSSFAGTIQKVHIKVGDKIKVGQSVFTFDGQDIAPTAGPKSPPPAKVPEPKKQVVQQPIPQPKAAAAPKTAPSQTATGGIAASPSVRRMAREMGIDLSQVSGSGPNGRILSEDLTAFSQEEQQSPAAETKAASAIPLPDFAKWGTIEKIPMTNVRRKTAERTANSWNTIPHVTQFDRADITQLERLRKQFGKRVEQTGGKLTLTVIIMKIIASALKVFPQFNASIDVPNETIISKKYFHIGVAVDTDRGLIVPVIRDVDKKNIIELAGEIGTAAENARQKKTTLEEMQGASFTITNLGSIGGTHFTPIINWPEVAILGVGQGSQEPVLVNDKFEPRLILPLSLSYDHRLIDGADAARFLRWVTNAVQEPFLMDLEG